MSLTGHLDIFPLEEVLRLLSRSYKSGCLRVDSPDLHGRVFLSNGSVSLATVATDEEFRRQLFASGLVREDALRSVELGGRTITDVVSPEIASSRLGEFVREEIVESLYRIRRPGRGQFAFNVDMNPRYPTGQGFDVDACVADADRRAAEWADIESVLASIDLPVRMTADIPDGEQVTLQANNWRLLAAFDGKATARGLADRLGISRFQVAKELATLLRAELLEIIEQPTVATAPQPTFHSTVPNEVVAEAAPVIGETLVIEETQLEDPVPANVPAAESVDSHNKSWWVEPEKSEKQEAEPGLGDGFLDRVFAQLEQETEETVEELPTPSFLKRRRMSSITNEENGS
jgi:hypothetical protein